MSGDRKDFGNVLYDRIRKWAADGRASEAGRGESKSQWSPSASLSETPSPRLIKPAKTAGQGPTQDYSTRDYFGMPAEADAAVGHADDEPEAPEPSPMTGRSIGSVLARLDARQAEKDSQETAAGTVSNRSLDAIVEDLLRPMLSDWLDQNLERIVREQVDEALQAEIAARERNNPSES